MTSRADPDPLDAAALWVARTRESSFSDWDAFTVWLEEDPSHNRAYELALDADALAGGLAMPANASAGAAEPAPRRAPLRRWASGALAILLAGAIGIGAFTLRHDPVVIATAAGEQRAVRLVDGSVVALNGATRISYDRAEPRRLRLEKGEATFSVVHDARDPFVVETRSTSIEDIGTVFNVVRSDGATDVGVAEGRVLYDPRGAAVELTAGRTLHDPDDGAIQIGDADPRAIGAWRHHRLIYRAIPFATIAADLSRATGMPILIDPAIASQTYTGTIALHGHDPAAIPDEIAPLLGLRAIRAGAGWRLSAK